MEVLLHKGGSPDLKMKIPSAADKESAEEVSTANLSKIRSSMEKYSISSLSNPKASSTISQEEQLENTRMEMGEVREENERLKLFLAQIVKDYQFLQNKYFHFVHQDQPKNISDPDSTTDANNNDIVEEESEQLVSLTLGMSSSASVQKVQVEEIKGGGADLSLGLDCKLFEGACRKGSAQNYESESNNNNRRSPEKSSTEEAKELDEPWLPSKAAKNVRSSNGGDDEVLQQPLAKKARVSIRVRCDAPTMNDGCQWRKYGQKIAKGNPCPRAYYRCTVAPGCPVRKQVQRCAEDTSILITTYEGTHNHPLSVAATAMASTTAAAVSMLTSTSSASPQGIDQGVGLSYSTATTPSLGGLNVAPFETCSRPFTPQSYLPIPSLSSTLPYPTITIDLTSPPPPWTPHLNHFNRLIPSPYSSTNFNFSSSVSAMSPPSWSNGILSSGAHPYTSSLSLIERQAQGFSHCQSILHKTMGSAPSGSNQNNPLITDSIAEAITSNPSFQSAIAAAITSYVRSHGVAQNGEGASSASHGLKLGEQNAQWNLNGCGSS